MPENLTSWLGFQRLMQSLVAALPNKSFDCSFFFLLLFEKIVNKVFSMLYTRTTVTTQECRSFTHSLLKILLEGNCFKLIYVVDTERQPSQIGQCGRW